MSLKQLARDNNIKVAQNISKPDLINILGERNLITTTPITAQESNLGVRVSNVPIELIRVAKKKARNAREALINFKDYIKNLKCYVHTQFYLALYMCVFILNSFPCGYF